MEIFRNLEISIRDSENEKAKSTIENFDLYQKASLFGDTALHLSAQHGNSFVTKCLLDDGSRVNAQNFLGWSPLMLALRERHEQVVAILLVAGADILMLNHYNECTLHLLFERIVRGSHIFHLALDQLKKQGFDSEDVARKLIDLGFSLDTAYLLNDIGIIEYMLQHGFQDDLSKPCSSQVAPYRQTLLHLAVESGDLEWVEFLLKYGADVSVKNEIQRIPVSCVYGENTEHHPDRIAILRVLLNAGPTTDVWQLCTTLLCGPREAIGVLLNSNLDFNARDKFNGLTALHYLAANVNPGVVDELRTHADKFDAKVRDKCGLIPLHMAAKFGNVNMLEYLLERGADVHPYTPLFSAYMNESQQDLKLSDQCVEILLQANFDSQFVFVKSDGQQITVFDVQMIATNTSSAKRLKPVVAQLALLEKVGTSITEIIRSKVDSQAPLKKHFEQCRRILYKKIGRVSVFQLLTADERKMAKYLNKRKLVMRLTRIGRVRRIKSRYVYYCNVLEKQFCKGFLYKTLRDKAKIVVSRLLEDRIDQSNIIIENIIDCLEVQDLRQLHRM